MSDRGFVWVKGCDAAFQQEPTAFTAQEIGIDLSTNVSMEVSVLGVKQSGQHLARWLVATGTWDCVRDEWMSPQKSRSKWNPRTATAESDNTNSSMMHHRLTGTGYHSTVPYTSHSPRPVKNQIVMLEYDGMSQTDRSVSLPPTYRNIMNKIQFAPSWFWSQVSPWLSSNWNHQPWCNLSITQRRLEMFLESLRHTVKPRGTKETGSPWRHQRNKNSRHLTLRVLQEGCKDSFFKKLFFNSEHLEHYLSNAVSCLYFSALPLTRFSVCGWRSSSLQRVTAVLVKGTLSIQ